MCLARLTAVFTTTLLSCVAVSEVPAIRSYFYVGGQYVPDGSGGKAGEHVLRGQMYVERLLPLDGVTQDAPVVLIHGQAQTGTNYLVKPDGGRGWASDFLQQGYEVYIVDQTLRGRSPSPSPRHHLQEEEEEEESSFTRTFSAEYVQQHFTATHKYGLWPQAVNHTQWPGPGVMGDAVFDAFYSATVQFVDDAVHQQTTVQKAGAALLDRIGKPVIIVGHSQGGVMPILIADARPELAKALVLLEPLGPPFRNAVFSNSSSRPWGLTDIPLQYSPFVTDPDDLVRQTYAAAAEGEHEGEREREHLVDDCVLQAESPSPRQLVNLRDKPILLVTGEASYHARYDHCTVDYLQQAGCGRTQHMKLADVGIHGNGHMFFLEKNSRAIQRVVQNWIEQQD